MWSDPEWGQSHEETVPEAEQTLRKDAVMYEFMWKALQGTPCAGCQFMSWDLLDDAPSGVCTVCRRNKYGRRVGARRACVNQGFEYYEPDEEKIGKAKNWYAKHAYA